ncbi:cytochrome P450 4c3-like [Hyposmocoma kahamanoa]|uniref:cytochrome P450 4c3-like n=1 Tax=Hyposmocoma kahamanoa TaxID=1477025 RepID=UPI000E6D855C|nr:cytochrome P450 4c3-like [Hyposmocoma kahamanoa]
MGLHPEKAFQFLRHSRRKYGRIHQLGAINITIITICEPKDVETVLSTTRYNEKQTPYNFLNSWLGDGLLISNGDKWKQRRKLLTPAFHFNILKGFASTFNEQTEKLLTKIEKLIQEEQVDVLSHISKATLNIMCETSMGTTLHEYTEAVANKYVKALHQLGQVLEMRYIKVWYHFDWLYRLSSFARTEKKLVQYLHAFTKKIIQERKDYRHSNVVVTADCMVYDKHRLAMLDLLLENEKVGKIDMNGIREEVDTFMFEGHDTTAMALSFMIMRVANEPDVQRNLNDELSQIFGCSSRSPTLEDLNAMKYLECCIKESLRLYPSVHYMARYSTEDIVLSGFTIPPGVVLHIAIYDIHHDPEIFPNPEEFIPERFLPENSVKRHPYSYIPFSAGPRNCIGQKFAMLQMKTIMSGLLRKFHLDPVTKTQDVVLMADMVLRSKDPLYVKFRPKEMTEH